MNDLTMKKILVPYDFSGVAKNALDFAADVARMTSGCGVTVINVIEQPTPETIKTMGLKEYDPMQNIYITKLIDTVKQKMEALMSDASFKDLKLDYKIVLGNPFNEISEEIKTQNIELVVMGTSGASGAEEFLVGSNAERMVRYSKCPVVTVAEPYDVSSIKKIAFATNFQDVSIEFMNHVKRLQNAFGASLHIVKINTPASFTTTRHDKGQFEEFMKDHLLDEKTEFSIYNYSNEEDGIVAFGEDADADMIALGTRQRRGVKHFLTGSIAEDVVNHAKVPVWTFGLDVE